ncbi:hypothetical protein [Jiella sp. M17.18]|uniref:hypothetical protein n=1 Tax=Jiella sp. M17.18 TaxID=3234247 RepID=UPI0034DE5917
MIYIVEHKGRAKPLDEVTAPEFRKACEPIVRMIEDRLGDDADFDALQVVFSVDPETGLRFDLRGDPVLVNAAIDRIGPQAEISPRHS